MNKYSEKRPCPKCGSTHISTEHEGDSLDEWMRRICVRCGYSWTEKPLDARD